MAIPATKLSRVIPAEHHALVMRLRSEVDPATDRVWSCEAIAAHLATLGVTCSRMAVIRLEARLSKRGDAILIEALRGTMLGAVGPMQARVVKASKHVAALVHNEEDAAKAATAMRALTGALDTLAKLAGVAAPMAVDVTSGGQPFNDPREALAAALARAATGDASGEASGPDREPHAAGG